MAGDFSILTVCTGNIHRSPLAAALLETWAGWYLPPSVAERVRRPERGIRRTRGRPDGLAGARDGRRIRCGRLPSSATQITDQAITGADLVLVATRRQREEVLARVPSALRATFTMREAGRIAEGMPDDRRPRSVSDLMDTVSSLTDHRGDHRDAAADDVIDPQGRDLTCLRADGSRGGRSARASGGRAVRHAPGGRPRVHRRGRGRGGAVVGAPRDGLALIMARPLRVAHLDHTSAPGGAQFALARMISHDVEWQPLLLRPAERARRRVRGARHTGAGAGARRRAAGRRERGRVADHHRRSGPPGAAGGGDASGRGLPHRRRRRCEHGPLRGLRRPRRSHVPRTFRVHLRDFVDPSSLGGWASR